jgi:hypothetical protein
MSSESLALSEAEWVETSRGEASRYLRERLRLRGVYPERAKRVERAPLRMTTGLCAPILFALACVSAAAAQESPTPIPSALPEESPSLSPASRESAAPSPTPTQTPSPIPPRKVRISFLPPPLEGTISLGIYDGNGTLVRVLHQQAELNEFTIGADGLVTHWDGRNDDDEDLPAGKYRAHGYLVGPLKIDDVGDATLPPPENAPPDSVKVKLIPNPLADDKRSIIDLCVGFDSDGSYLETVDELPLFMLSEAPNLIRAFIVKKTEKSVIIWQDDGTSVRQFRISNVDKMMGFDCGEFELK